LLCEDTPPQFFGTTNISGNRLMNLGITAISLDYTFGAVIADNELSGGATCVGCYDGIYSYCSGALTVSENTIDGFRNGISIQAASATLVSENKTSWNRTGINLEGIGDAVGPNLVEENISANNHQLGILANYVGASSFANNVLKHNGSDPNFHGGFLMKFSEYNSITENNITGNSGFGIVLQSTQDNVVGNNKTELNGGAGIVLINASNNNRSMPRITIVSSTTR
jgi:parallel beta-helix repeat protein